MPPNENEVDKFFDELPQEDETIADIFAAPTVEPVPEKEEATEPHKNRQHRRLEKQLNEERQARLDLEKKFNEISQKETPRVATDMPAEWVALYGDTPEAEKAWKMQEVLMSKFKQEAKAEALTELTSQREREAQEQRQYESYIDSQLESLEDEHNIDLTSDAPAARKARRELLELVEKLSPKNEHGDVTAFADFGTTWNMLNQARQKPSNVQQKKDIASQAMNRSGTVDITKTHNRAEVEALRKMGINI